MQQENGRNKQRNIMEEPLTSKIKFPCILDVVSLFLSKNDCAGDGDVGILSGLVTRFFEGIPVDGCGGDHTFLDHAVK